MQNYAELERLIDEKQFYLLKNGVTELNAADTAAMVETLPPEKMVLLFRVLPKDYAAEVFTHLYTDTKQMLVEQLSDAEISRVIETLFLDDAADFIEEMPATIATKVLDRATEQTRRQINQLLKYPEFSAGSIMTMEYVSLKRDITVTQAFERIRKVGSDKETIYTCYVTNPERKIEGVVTAKRLMLSQPDALLSDIMDTSLIFVHTHDDQEEIAKLFEKYDLLNLPVVDSENRLVGIITIDDIVDVVNQEATEDFEKMAAMAPSDKPYMKTSVVKLAQNRLPWLMFLMMAAMITESIIRGYEKVLGGNLALLSAFIPMITGSGGNAGSQSSTLVIRGMALDEIKVSDVLKVLWKEMRVGILCGIGLGLVNFVRVFITSGSDAVLSLAVTLSLMSTLIFAKSVGCILPIAAKKCKIDPAVMAAPLISTIVDSVSLTMFFTISKLLLGL